MFGRTPHEEAEPVTCLLRSVRRRTFPHSVQSLNWMPMVAACGGPSSSSVNLPDSVAPDPFDDSWRDRLAVWPPITHFGEYDPLAAPLLSFRGWFER